MALFASNEPSTVALQRSAVVPSSLTCTVDRRQGRTDAEYITPDNGTERIVTHPPPIVYETGRSPDNGIVEIHIVNDSSFTSYDINRSPSKAQSMP
jgi:hypothetical protein